MGLTPPIFKWTTQEDLVFGDLEMQTELKDGMGASHDLPAQVCSNLAPGLELLPTLPGTEGSTVNEWKEVVD